MKLERVDGGFAVRVPDDIVRELGLREGDDVNVVPSFSAAKQAVEDRERLLARLRSLRGRLPADYRFDREEANARQ